MTREHLTRRFDRIRKGVLPAPMSRPGAREMTVLELLKAAKECWRPGNSMYSSLCGHQPDVEITRQASDLIQKHWDTHWDPTCDNPNLYENLPAAFDKAIAELEQ